MCFRIDNLKHQLDLVPEMLVAPVIFENLLWNLLCGCDIEIFQCLLKSEITMELIKNENIFLKKEIIKPLAWFLGQLGNQEIIFL